jgi:hypothetical protein
MITMNLEGKQRDLSGVCSALWATRDWESDIEEDLAMFGAPSEFHPIAFKGMDRRREEIAAQWGWTLGSLLEELKRRTTYKWIYFHLHMIAEIK